RPRRVLALGPGDETGQIKEAPVAHAHLRAFEGARARAAGVAVVERKDEPAARGEPCREPRVVAARDAGAAGDDGQRSRRTDSAGRSEQAGRQLAPILDGE